MPGLGCACKDLFEIGKNMQCAPTGAKAPLVRYFDGTQNDREIGEFVCRYNRCLRSALQSVQDDYVLQLAVNQGSYPQTFIQGQSSI